MYYNNIDIGHSFRSRNFAFSTAPTGTIFQNICIDIHRFALRAGYGAALPSVLHEIWRIAYIRLLKSCVLPFCSCFISGSSTKIITFIVLRTILYENQKQHHQEEFSTVTEQLKHKTCGFITKCKPKFCRHRMLL